jgi:5-hydroxyisourate hydrolase-like protein (transthyretin family)
MFRSAISTRRTLFQIALAASLVLALATLAHAQDDNSKRGRKYKAPPPTAHFEITVLRATTGKPIENAAVIFHPLTDGKDNGNMELKTNEDGKTTLDLLEIGSNVRIQIIAPGFQTYGQDYKIDKDNIVVEVKLKRPAKQYSIYEHPQAADAAPKPGDAAPKDPAPDASKDAAPKDTPKPADPAPQSK